MESWDLIIIGARSAGLTAGIYGARSGLCMHTGFKRFKKLQYEALDCGVRVLEFESPPAAMLLKENTVY